MGRKRAVTADAAEAEQTPDFTDATADGIQLPIKYYQVEVMLLNPMLGTVPLDPKIYGAYIESKKHEHQAKFGDISPEDMAEIESRNVENLEEKGWTGFHRDLDADPSDPNYGRHFIYNYLVKGCLKNAGQVLNGAKITVNGKSVHMPSALKSKVSKAISVAPRKIYLPFIAELDLEKDEKTGLMRCKHVNERPLRAQTQQGERVALARSDYLPAGSKLQFELRLLDISYGITPAHLHALLRYGEYHGLGQWANAEFGAFKYTMQEIDRKDSVADSLRGTYESRQRIVQALFDTKVATEPAVQEPAAELVLS